MLTPIQVREAVHVTLLRRLVERVPEGLRLKGGVNLRLFFGSVRYSEDMDLDAEPRHRAKLQGVIETILADAGYRRELDALGIEDIRPNDAQRGTGEAGLRLKMQATAAGIGYSTKVEISYRDSSPAAWAAPAPVPAKLIARYGGARFEVARYEHAAAVVQKVNALATRGDVQARDIFDLDWLLDEARFPDAPEPALVRLRAWHPLERLETARSRCLEIGDDQYRGQVETFLDVDAQRQFAGTWDAMRLRVHDLLERAAALEPKEATE